MWRSAIVLGVSLSLCFGPSLKAAEAPPTDPDVIKGIKLVDDGDFDAAILTLDNAARRLATDPAKARELSSAYLYLGIAYMGKGHEAAAKAKFREALTQIKDITLSPDKYPPKVIDAFEAARSESKAQSPAVATAPEKKGGSKKGLLIVGGVLAAGGAVALAAGGGGGDSAPASTPAPRSTENFSGTLDTDEIRRTFRISVVVAGNVDATATWTDSASVLGLHLLDSNFNQVGPSANRTSNTTLTLGPQPVAAGTYHVEIEYDTCNGAEVQSAGAPVRKAARPDCTTNFTASATHP